MKNWELFHLLGVVCLTIITTVDGRHGHGSGKDNSHHHHHHIHHYRHGATMARCSKCLPGHFVSKQCEGTNDNECQACPSDTYSPHHTFRQSCFVCSRCGEGLYVARSCVPTRDTVCDSCHTYRGPHNRDYQEKCLSVKKVFKEDSKRGKHASKGSRKSRVNVNTLEKDEDIPEHLPSRPERLVSHPLLEEHNMTSKTTVSVGQEKEAKTGPAISSLTIAAVFCLLFMSVVAIAITFRWCWRKRKVTSDGRTYTQVETMEIVAL